MSDGYDIAEVEDGEEAVAHIQARAPDALLLDLSLPRRDGLSVLRWLQSYGVSFPVVVITGLPGLAPAIEATRLGAHEYLTKPCDLQQLSRLLSRLLERQVPPDDIEWLRDRDTTGYERLIGASTSMLRVFDTLRRLESIDAPTVVLSGESGSGKNLLAQAIHARGPRRDRPYLEIDCAAIPDTLIESELFGHERGSFTDARQTKRGLFEVAAGGVLFLDEIGEISLVTQAKLLRALENRRFKRIGGVVDLALDAAIVVATNRNLRAEVKAGRFREDLFFRLNVVPIEVPPLRRRPEDIVSITLALVDQGARTLGRHIPGVSRALLRRLSAHSWPGNARELRNTVDRMLILKRDDGVLTLDDLPSDALVGRPASGSTCGFELPPGGVALSVVESSLIEQALLRTHGNQTQAAKLLGITRFTLRHRGLRHGVSSLQAAPPEALSS